MKFSIITPSYNQINWLRLCVLSVRSQLDFIQTSSVRPSVENVDSTPSNPLIHVEHIIQDGGSPGIEDFASEAGANYYRDGCLIKASCSSIKNYSLSIYTEQDSGMYDAINRGILKSKGDVVCQLNCDEQYLANTLVCVADVLSRDKNCDILLGDVIIINSDGRYKFSRRVLVPLYSHTAVCQLNTFTAATFIRRRSFAETELLFDTQYQCIADASWMLRAIESKKRFFLLRKFTSVFMEDGNNLGLATKSKSEMIKLRAKHPIRAAFHKILTWHHRFRRFCAGYYWESPFCYSIYMPGGSTTRSTVHVQKPEPVFKSRI